MERVGGVVRGVGGGGGERVCTGSSDSQEEIVAFEDFGSWSRFVP